MSGFSSQTCQIVILGDASEAKLRLWSAFTGIGSMMPIVNTGIRNVELEEVRMKMHCTIDIASNSMFRVADIAFFVYDKSDFQSFQKLSEVVMFSNRFADVSKAFKVVVGVQKMNSPANMVPLSMVQSFAKSKGMSFNECNLSRINEGIRLLQEILPLYLAAQPDDIRKRKTRPPSPPRIHIPSPPPLPSRPVFTPEEMTEALSTGKKAWGRSKVMLVGEGRAGKTALTNSIIGKPFQDTSSTIGINQLTCTVSQTLVVDSGSSSSSQEQATSWGEYCQPSHELETAIAQLILTRQKSSSLPSDTANVTMQTTAMSQEEKDRLFLAELDEMKQRYEAVKDELLDESAQIILTDGTDKAEPLRQVTEDSIDNQLVAKCLADNIHLNSKFFISIFDFGGQSVFNVVHPFFLTRYGVYLLVFNMEWLCRDTDPVIKQQCLSYLSFWMNSIVVHTYNSTTATGHETAPIALVGTRKDIITNPADHEYISTVLFERFGSNICWPFIQENIGEKGVNGRIDLTFFPVDNCLGQADLTVVKLLKVIDEVIEKSSYVHIDCPLTWFHAMDIMKMHATTTQSYLTYSQVQVITLQCGIEQQSLTSFLLFLHEMGVLMWHNDEYLREIIILNPVEYFVTPATKIICKHVPSNNDPTYHTLDIHRKARRLLTTAWREMISHGIISEPLIDMLLEEYSETHRETIKRLMIKYGLLVPLTTNSNDSNAIRPVLRRAFTRAKTAKHVYDDLAADNDGEEEQEEHRLAVKDSALAMPTADAGSTNTGHRRYLAPALLPDQPPATTSSTTSSSSSLQSSFYFIFAASAELTRLSTISTTDCRTLGFLPSGIFEKLIGKAVTWSLQTSNHISIHASSEQREEVQLHSIYKNHAELAFGNQLFSITALPDMNAIFVQVEGSNPVIVHDRLKDQLVDIIHECFMSSLRFLAAVAYAPDEEKESKEEQQQLLLVPLKLIKTAVRDHHPLTIHSPTTASSTHRLRLLTWQEVVTLFSAWVHEYQEFDEYDLFISYRWGVHDSPFALQLFDRMSLYSIDVQLRAIRVFLDNKRLRAGRDFQHSFVVSLMRSRVFTPIISADALQKMITINDCNCSLVEDNVLIEWICALQCINHPQCQLKKILPIIFGSHTHNSIGNLFAEGLIDRLPHVVPTACMSIAQRLLSSQGIDLSDAIACLTVNQLVKQLLKYLSFLAWDVIGHHEGSTSTSEKQWQVAAVAAGVIVREVEESVVTAAAQSTSTAVVGSKPSSSATPIMAAADPAELTSKASSESMPLIQLINFIRESYGIAPTNFQDVLYEAAENLSAEELKGLATLHATREKALYIARCAGL